ncbi:MAG: NADH:flavin oxidoreductase [Syntrophobacterales bacterium]|jgi:2,4-dienoyl-CoA reductase (NADPH2)|nr:NADH:flavin oxidoreductase [Syntrophobacterales bacterium]
MKILEPIKCKNLELKNRLAWTPAVTCLADEDGFVTDALIDRHAKRAKSGVGFIMVEACGVNRDKSPMLLRLCGDDYIEGHKKLTDACHAYGAKLSIQLIHYMKQSPRNNWKRDIADLSKDEIDQIVREYVNSAVCAKKAGYDAIELHVAHGYTLSSFVSLLNKRNDEYGKTTAGRCKIVTDIIARCREELGDDYCIGARISGEEFVMGGNTLKQTTVIAKIFCEAGLNFLSVSGGGKTEDGFWYTGYSGERCMAPASYPLGLHLYLGEGIREVCKDYGVPVIIAGKIPDLKYGEEEVLARGKADIVGVCRPMLADPEWFNKQLEGREGEIVKCSYCNTCMDRDRAFEPVNCIVWEKFCAKKGVDPYVPLYRG